MKKTIFVVVILFVVLGFFFVFMKKGTKEPAVLEQPATFTTNKTQPMKISSPAFEHNQPISFQYTCDGKDVNPPLQFFDVPSGVKSLAFIVDDPDAPMGTWVHWTLWNIPPGTTAIAENSVPAKTVEGVTSFGKPGYGGPCPPSGTHRYVFKLYALDTMLALGTSAMVKDLEAAMAGHILAQAELIGLYKRE